VRYRFVTVAIGFFLFFASLAGARFLSTGFLPVTDTARSMLGIELPPGSQLSDTEAVTDTIAKRLGSWPEVAGIFVNGGRMPSGPVEVGKAAITINYVPKSKRRARSRTSNMRLAATSPTFRTSAIGSSTIMDSETSNSSSPAKTTQR
jgi:multidrug efflux pump subunit AcrB